MQTGLAIWQTEKNIDFNSFFSKQDSLFDGHSLWAEAKTENFDITMFVQLILTMKSKNIWQNTYHLHF